MQCSAMLCNMETTSNDSKRDDKNNPCLEHTAELQVRTIAAVTVNMSRLSAAASGMHAACTASHAGRHDQDCQHQAVQRKMAY